MTKNKKLHPIRAWICFALAMTLLWGGIGIAIGFGGELYDYRDTLWRLVPKVMQLEYHETDLYWDDLLEYMRYLNEAITGESPVVVYDEEKGRFVNDYRFTREADEAAVTETVADVTYTTDDELFIIATDSDETPSVTEAETAVPDVTTVAIELTEPITDVIPTSYIGEYLINDVRARNLSYSVTRGNITISDGSSYDYGYGLAWVGGELYVIGENNRRPVAAIPGTDLFGTPYQDVPALREYLRDVTANGYARDILTELDPTVTIILQPNSRIVDSYGGLLSTGQRQTYALAALCWGIVALLTLIIALFVGTAIDHRSKAAADAAVGRRIGRIWIELRLLILFFAFCFYICLIDTTDEAFAYTFLIATVWFWLYCIAADLRQNGLRTFRCNIVMSIIELIHRCSARLPLHKTLSRRVWVYGVPTLLCAFAAFLFFGFSSETYGFWMLAFLIAGAYCTVGALAFILLYFRSRNEDYADIAALTRRICEIREGRGSAPLVLPSSHRFAPYAAALESIYSGIETAVAERTKSERTKIEMITNISHDLKTPLTSIVGYADLLAGVEGLPPEAADYVSVITKKSARLNALIKDLFDLSKATTNDLPLRPEPLDLVRLIHQLLAEQADAIAAAPVTLITDLPEHECPLENDGTKLYRIFANLLENALRYALDGSRVFLSLRSATNAEGTAVWRVVVKNTSREFIDFTEEEILARFVRGDKNRTTEGNGLGLPIAKSFTELCGGTFTLKLDGDIFCVTVDFPQKTYL